MSIDAYFDVIICGGGPAGVFAAIWAAKNGKKVCIVEKSDALLTKVYISGGGRCNLTNTNLDTDNLDVFYPRGYKEMRQILYQYTNTDIIQWFSSHGCDIKTEQDGRCFPKDDKAATIVAILLKELNSKTVDVCLQHQVDDIQFLSTTGENPYFLINCSVGGKKNDIKHHEQHKQKEKTVFLKANKLIMATGNNKKCNSILSNIGITLKEFVPSLYALKCSGSFFEDLAGITLYDVTIESKCLENKDEKHMSKGSLVFTHDGFSGPCVLNFTSYAAYALYESNYSYNVCINWVSTPYDKGLKMIIDCKEKKSTKNISNENVFELPKRFWEKILDASGIRKDIKWNNVSYKDCRIISRTLTSFEVTISGKAEHSPPMTYAGGVDCKFIDMKTMESRNIPHLYFCGEIHNIDGITGGYNFQNAWSTGYIAGKTVK